MTASATAPTREKAERARENSEYVRSLLNMRQPQFAAALEAAARKLLRDHGTVCASSQRSSQPGWAPEGDWSGRRDLNSRPSPWQGDALPLSYSRLSQA